jgi:hypothetical protein
VELCHGFDPSATMELLIRFLAGGAVVMVFALIGDVVRPKSFAGIFGAAPSVALATLALTLHNQGAPYAATEARSMIVGAVAMVIYTWVSSRVLWRVRTSVPTVTIAGLSLWLVAALLGWLALLRGLS